jgi:hypothetical protein
MQSTGNWKAAASVFVVLCLMGTQFGLDAWAQDAESNLKIVLMDEGRRDNGREIRVNVQNGGAPASGAQVVFNLPSTGPSGFFENGSRSVTVHADDRGSASSGIIQPNNQPGPFTVLVAATQGGATTQTAVQKSNPTVDKGKPFWKKKWFLIGAGAAAAAVAIVLVSNRKPQADVTVGAPTVGAPQ